jgi:hypothetical protein
LIKEKDDMRAIVLKKDSHSEITVVEAMRDYSIEPVFKKKADKAIAFLKKHGIPKTNTRKKKNS